MALPRTVEGIAACQASGTAIIARAGGRSTPDNAVGPASLLDCSRHLHKVLVIDDEAETVDVELGVVGTLRPARWHATGDCRTPESHPWSATAPRRCRARQSERAILDPEGKVSRPDREGFPGHRQVLTFTCMAVPQV